MEALINFFFSVKLILFALPFSLIFSWRQEKRSFFWLRCISFIAVASVLHYFIWEWTKYNTAPHFLFFTVLFVGYCLVLVVVFSLTCFKCRFVEALLFAVGAFAVEHLANCLSIIISISLKIEGVLYRPYTAESFYVTLAVYLITFALFNIIFSFLIKDRRLDIDKKHLIAPIVAVFAIFDLMNHWVNMIFYDDTKTLFVTKLYALAFSVLLLIFIANLFESSKYRVELQVLEQLERKGQEQYKISKDTIDLINTKCHDIKKLLSSSLPNGSVLSQEDVESLQEKISIYDNLFVTDNKTLNIVLNEKSLYCEKNGIHLSVAVSYSHLDFMSKMDIYSLFGNILDNAIEAVMKLPLEKRMITLTVKKVGEMLLIHTDNLFEGELQFDGANIITSKKDKTAHGYGLLSIRRMVDKYGGAVKLGTANNVFVLDIVIPISEQK